MTVLEDIKQKLAALKPELMRRYPLAYIGIFGSVARGDNRVDSDVDIIVDFTDTVGIRFVDLAEELEQRLGRKVDLVERDALRDRLYKFIEPDIVYV